jgi:hypothetical protein
MIVLALLLLFDAALHAFVIYRFGLSDRNNTPFLIYAIVDLVLAVAVFFAWPYALWATLILSAIGIIGLTVTFNKPQREKTIDKAIWLVDALIVIGAIYLLFFAGSGAAPTTT